MKIIITESQYKFLIENQEVVDRILDKISEKGIKSLSIDEKRYLDEFSKHKGHPDEFIDPAERYDERRGEKFTSNFRNIPNITFTFDDEEIEDNQSILHGTIDYGDKSYWGVLIVNKLGHLIDLDFVDSGVGTAVVDSWVGILNGKKTVDTVPGHGYRLVVNFPA